MLTTPSKSHSDPSSTAGCRDRTSVTCRDHVPAACRDHVPAACRDHLSAACRDQVPAATLNKSNDDGYHHESDDVDDDVSLSAEATEFQLNDYNSSKREVTSPDVRVGSSVTGYHFTQLYIFVPLLSSA